MTEPASDNPAQRHYETATGGADDLVARVSQALAADGAADIGSLDQFHVGGSAASARLGALLGLREGMAVLDAGSGLGGPSRGFAAEYRCHVTGVDLSASYVAVARMLAARDGLADLLDYRCGDVTALDFADASFDAVYTQHVAMNIADRAGFYREMRRVLKPGGVFGFYDVLAGDSGPVPVYPVPWAETAATSFLTTEAQTRAALAGAGLAPRAWIDTTADGLAWIAAQRALPRPAANLGLVMGPRFAAMAANLARNLADGRLRLAMAVCDGV
jgi:ubiquinone/menaquinone biosynthesis C-methylase UbiE